LTGTAIKKLNVSDQIIVPGDVSAVAYGLNDSSKRYARVGVGTIRRDPMPGDPKEYRRHAALF
jgi:hypothetical protein